MDSSASFSEAELNEHGFLMAHLTYSIDGVEYIDAFQNDGEKQAFYDKLAAGQLAQSSKVNPERFKEIWEEPLSQGYDILHLSLSGQVSGSHDSACQAARELCEKYSNRIEVVDTRTGSFAVSALALDLAKIQNTATIDEAKQFALDNLDEYNLIFTVGDIKHLSRGGRISHTKAFVGGLLHLKPVLYVNGEGKLMFIMNARGMKKAISLIVGKMAKSITTHTNAAYIAHGGDIETAKTLKEKLLSLFPNLQNITIDYLTPVLGLHAGPGSLVLSFRGASRDRVLEENPIQDMLDKLHAAKLMRNTADHMR